MSFPDENLPRLTYEEFNEIHPNIINPIGIKINVDDFKRDISQYRSKFRQWGNKRTQWPRYGISLMNLTGNIDDLVDPACWPLDHWWKSHPDELYWDNDFNKQTEVLDMPSLDCINSLKPYLVRSNILLWDEGGHFVPHIDMHKDHITHLRLWGVTTDSSGYELKYGDINITDFEPGQLYLMDTIQTHQARALEDDVYTFFLAVDIDILNHVMIVHS